MKGASAPFLNGGGPRGRWREARASHAVHSRPCCVIASFWGSFVCIPAPTRELIMGRTSTWTPRPYVGSRWRHDRGWPTVCQLVTCFLVDVRPAVEDRLRACRLEKGRERCFSLALFRVSSTRNPGRSV